MGTTTNYREEFPRMPEMPEVAQLLALGFTDESWHNDSAPTFVSADQKIRVWIECPDKAQREDPEGDQFGVQVGDFSDYPGAAGDDFAYSGDDWAEVLKIIQKTPEPEYIADTVSFDLGPRDDDAPSIFLAMMETTNFSFQAAGTNEREARGGIARAAMAHAKQYELRPDWFKNCEVQITEMKLGAGYRDGAEVQP